MVSSSVLSHPGASPVALKDSAGSASTPPSGILRARARNRPVSTAQKKLPAWPLLALLYGFPAPGALGPLPVAALGPAGAGQAGRFACPRAGRPRPACR